MSGNLDDLGELARARDRLLLGDGSERVWQWGESGEVIGIEVTDRLWLWLTEPGCALVLGGLRWESGVLIKRVCGVIGMDGGGGVARDAPQGWRFFGGVVGMDIRSDYCAWWTDSGVGGGGSLVTGSALDTFDNWRESVRIKPGVVGSIVRLAQLRTEIAGGDDDVGDMTVRDKGYTVKPEGGGIGYHYVNRIKAEGGTFKKDLPKKARGRPRKSQGPVEQAEQAEQENKEN